VSSRGELVARIYFDHYAPRLAEETPVGRMGSFEPPESADEPPRRRTTSA
jgi:hypothetical protein